MILKGFDSTVRILCSFSIRSSILVLRSGYESASKAFIAGDLDVDCRGKSYMITGGNSGIGKCMAHAIAKRGGEVHLVCRNTDSAQQARDEIVRDTGNEVS